MKQLPILFSGPMVRAILEGRKSMTRRLSGLEKVNEEPDKWRFEGFSVESGKAIFTQGARGVECRARYAPGDKLWIKETWRPRISHHCCMDTCDCSDVYVEYAADNSGEGRYFRDEDIPEDWLMPKAAKRGNVSPLLMPKWAARIWLRVLSVRVERLRDISEADAIAEGLVQWSDPPRVPSVHYGIGLPDVWETDPRKAFTRLWSSINGPGSWEANPWLWVIEFERAEKPEESNG